MTQISGQNAAASFKLSEAHSARVADGKVFKLAKAKERSADDVRATFTQFVGETFYGQMIKAMRSTVGKPAYFHGGRGEDVFQGQLDQQMGQHLTESTAAKFSDPLFERQFPLLAARSQRSDLHDLTQLRRQ